MATKVNKSLAAWQSYEQGVRVPGGEVYFELLGLGININWLLSGQGEMLLEQPNPVPQQEQTDNMQGIIDDAIDLAALMYMPSEDFWHLFNKYGKLSPAQSGWTQLEVAKRFPEFRKWLKKEIEMLDVEIESNDVWKKIA